MKLAPIGISTYSRINHLKRTIEALQKNTLANESELYIFSDAPKQGDEKIVAELREYIHTIEGFKKVHIIERLVNDRVINNREGVKQLLYSYGKMIFLEDDIVTSPYFLQFMNNGLEYFYKNDKIFAITGYNVPVKYPKDLCSDYYYSSEFTGWGYATWQNRCLPDIINNTDAYKELLNNKILYKRIKSRHPQLVLGLKSNYENIIDAGDYKITFHLLKNHLYTIRPIISYVNNTGHDGSGVHCIESNKFENIKLNNNIIEFSKDVAYNKKIDLLSFNYVWKNKFFTKRLPNRIKKKINSITMKIIKSSKVNK